MPENNLDNSYLFTKHGLDNNYKALSEFRIHYSVIQTNLLTITSWWSSFG